MITTRQAMLSIWTQPRATIAQLCEVSSSRAVFTLVILGGIVSVLDKAVTKSLGDAVSMTVILAVAIAIGPIFGLIGLYVGPWVLAKTGSWIGGNGDRRRLRIAWAWSYAIPVVIGLLYIPQILLFGNELFTSASPSSPGLGITMLGFGALEFIAGCWAIVVMTKAVGEAQGFSAWKALLNLLIALIVAGLPLFLVVAAVAILSLRQ